MSPHIHLQRIWLVSVILAVGAVMILSVRPAPTNAQGVGTPITGYAWSDTIGWLSLSGASYGLSVASNGDISGYAWSDNVGWVSANTADVSGCPSGSCKAKISGNNMQGWLRVLSQDGNGWDGWISLQGSGYGVSLDQSAGVFSGYAWGSDVVGWVDFSFARTTFGTDLCPNISGNQATVPIGYTLSGGNCVDYCTPQSYCSGNDRYVNTIPVNTCVSSFSQTCSYQCAVGTCLAPPPPSFNPDPDADTTGHLQVRPSLLPAGGFTTVFWNVSNVTSCTVVGDNTPADSWTVNGTVGNGWTSTSGSDGIRSASIEERTTYTLSCTALEGQTFDPETAVVNVLPVFIEL